MLIFKSFLKLKEKNIWNKIQVNFTIDKIDKTLTI